MDPIHPIVPGPLPIPRGMLPVDRLERVSRERDRPSKDRKQPRRQPPPQPPESGEDDDGRPHVDVRV